MIKFKYNHIDFASVLWLASGIMTFLLGWCRWYIAWPVVILLICVITSFYKENTLDRNYVTLTKHQLLWSSVLTVILMIYCGIGGYIVQPNDHFGRNAIFKAICEYSWPGYDNATDSFICYYHAIWLVPAMFAKLFSSIEIGFFAQLIWISIGAFLLFLEICRYIRKAKTGIIFFIWFFAGLTLIEYLILSYIGDTTGNNSSVIRTYLYCLTTNSSPNQFQACPLIQSLYDPFNQTIPYMLGFMLILNNTKSKYIVFIYSLLLLYGPFPFIGMCPVIIYLLLKNIKGNTIIPYTLRCLFSYQNICGLMIMLICGLYFLSNINGGEKGIRHIEDWATTIAQYIIYLVFEFGIFIYLGYKVCNDKSMLWIMTGTVCILAWFTIGLHNDLCFRSNMPLQFFLCLLIISRYYSSTTTKRTKAIILSLILIGGIPAQIHPTLRLVSSGFIIAGKDQSTLNKYQSVIDVKQLYIMQQTEMRNTELDIFNCGEWDWMCESFRGKPDSFFYKHIAKNH